MSKIIAVVATVVAMILVYLNGRKSQSASSSRKAAAAAEKATADVSAEAAKAKTEAVAAKTEAAVATEAAGIAKQAAADDQEVQKDYEDCLAKIEKASDSGNFDDILAIARQQARKAKELQEDAKKRE